MAVLCVCVGGGGECWWSGKRKKRSGFEKKKKTFQDSHPRAGAPGVDDEHVFGLRRQGRCQERERERRGEKAAEEHRGG